MFGEWFKGAATSLVAAGIVVLAGSLAQAQDMDKWLQRVRMQPHAIWPQAEVDGGASVVLGDHWIGVHCQPVNAALTTHLKLDHGLVVHHVIPDSAAQEAGIQQHDILLSMGEKPLKQVVDLVEAVKAAADKETEMKLVREGKEMTLKVTPEKRPADDRQLAPSVATPQEAFKKWQESLRQNQPGEPFRWHRFHPGIVLPENMKEKLELPGNLSISISKHGNEKAEITVKRGDQTWTVNEDDLETLPEDVRPHVKRFLGSGRGIELDVEAFEWLPENMRKQLPRQPWKNAPTVPQFRVFPGKPGDQMLRVEKKLRDQLKDMQRAIDDMREQLDELRGKTQPAPEKKQGEKKKAEV